jgi:hypothetical protein
VKESNLFSGGCEIGTGKCRKRPLSIGTKCLSPFSVSALIMLCGELFIRKAKVELFTCPPPQGTMPLATQEKQKQEYRYHFSACVTEACSFLQDKQNSGLKTFLYSLGHWTLWRRQSDTKPQRLQAQCTVAISSCGVCLLEPRKQGSRHSGSNRPAVKHAGEQGTDREQGG